MYRFLNAVGEDSVDCPRDDCWGMNPCCVVFTPNQLNIITFHFSGLNLLYLACITNDRKAQANTDVFFFFPTLILAYEPWKWKIKTAVLMELSWLWCSLFQMWLNPICIHDITRCRCVLPFSSFIEKTENLCFKIYLIYKIHLYNSTNDVEQKAMWNIQPSHLQGKSRERGLVTCISISTLPSHPLLTHVWVQGFLSDFSWGVCVLFWQCAQILCSAMAAPQPPSRFPNLLPWGQTGN